MGKEISALSFNRELAENQLREMRSQITLNGIRLLMYAFNKNMRKSMQGLFVDTKGIEMVKRMIKSGYKVIFMPLYKTYIDFLVLTYVHQIMGIPHGFTLGNFEDTPRIVFFDHILRSTGYILSRRKHGQSMQSRYINSALVRELIGNSQVVTIFQNAERYRANKLT